LSEVGLGINGPNLRKVEEEVTLGILDQCWN